MFVVCVYRGRLGSRRERDTNRNRETIKNSFDMWTFNTHKQVFICLISRDCKFAIKGSHLILRHPCIQFIATLSYSQNIDMVGVSSRETQQARCSRKQILEFKFTWDSSNPGVAGLTKSAHTCTHRVTHTHIQHVESQSRDVSDWRGFLALLCLSVWAGCDLESR